MLLQNLYVLFSIDGAFTDVIVTHDAIGTDTHSHTIRDGIGVSFEATVVLVTTCNPFPLPSSALHGRVLPLTRFL